MKERLSRTIERGPIGALVKKANGFACQLCAALGNKAVGFRRRDGAPYVEAHHVTLVSRNQIGSLWATNILTLCANHHRQVHYGHVQIAVHESDFEIVVDGTRVTITRPTFAIST